MAMSQGLTRSFSLGLGRCSFSLLLHHNSCVCAYTRAILCVHEEREREGKEGCGCAQRRSQEKSGLSNSVNRGSVLKIRFVPKSKCAFLEF